MVAVLVSFAFIRYWLAIELAIAGLLPEQNDADFLAAAGLRMRAISIPIFWLNRLSACFAEWQVTLPSSVVNAATLIDVASPRISTFLRSRRD